MPQLLTFPRHLVPRELACQVRSFVRVQWPFLPGTSDRIWDYSLPADESMSRWPTHFLLIDGEVLVSHASVNFRVIERSSHSYLVGGLSTVFTYPAYRGAGCADQVVRAATRHLRASEADLAMLFCGEPLRDFYSAAGWTAADQARIFHGDRHNPTRKTDNLVMMLFISKAGRAAQAAFQTEDVYVGAQTW